MIGPSIDLDKKAQRIAESRKSNKEKIEYPESWELYEDVLINEAKNKLNANITTLQKLWVWCSNYPKAAVHISDLIADIGVYRSMPEEYRIMGMTSTSWRKIQEYDQLIKEPLKTVAEERDRLAKEYAKKLADLRAKEDSIVKNVKNLPDWYVKYAESKKLGTDDLDDEEKVQLFNVTSDPNKSDTEKSQVKITLLRNMRRRFLGPVLGYFRGEISF
jgi:hypothetical protein